MEDYELDWCFGWLLCFVTPTLSKEKEVDDEREDILWFNISEHF